MEKREFLNLSAVFEGGMFFLALILGYLFSVDPLQSLRWSWTEFGIGIAGLFPLFLLFLVTLKSKRSSFSEIREFLIESIAPRIAACTPYELIGIALLAGVGEEVFFRGFLQVSLETPFGATGGLIFKQHHLWFIPFCFARLCNHRNRSRVLSWLVV